jgi:hypothetical protein
VRKCKYWRLEVKKRMRLHYINDINNPYNNDINNKIVKANNVKEKDIYDYLPSSIIGYDIKEIIVIIIIGICLIFILDLFVRIGRKTMKK